MSTTVETTTAPEISSFLAGVSASFLLKLTTSVDDLVWFSPFLAMSTSTPQRLKYCCVYAVVCVIVAVAALCLARAAELLQEGRLVDAASVLEPVRTRANPQNAVGGALAIAMTAERRWS